MSIGVEMPCMAARQEAARIPNKKERYPRVPRQKQQSRRQHGVNGFAFVPHTRRFLGQQSLGVEPAVKRGGFFTFPPVPCRGKEGAQADWGRLASARQLVSGKRWPRRLRVEAEFFTQLAIRGTCSNYAARCRRK